MRSCLWALGLLLIAGSATAQQSRTRPPGIPELEAQARADSNDATVHYALAMAYWDKKKWDDADRALRQAVQLAPNYADAWLALSQLPWRRGEGYWKKVKQASGDSAIVTMLYESSARYRRAFLLNPLVDLGILGKFAGPEGMSFIRTQGGFVFYFRPWWSQELSRAVNEFREAKYDKAFERIHKLAVDARSGGAADFAESPVLFYHGLAAAHLGNFDEAVQNFAVLTRRAMNEEQDTARVEQDIPLGSNHYRFMLATFLYLGGRYEQAIPTFRRALEFDLSLYMAHVQLARMYEQRGQIEEALAERRLALDVDQDNSDLVLDLAATLVRSQRTADAVEPLAEAARANPRDARIPYLQGVVAVELRQSDAAREAFSRFLAIAPSRFEAQRVEARAWLADPAQ